jgi:hypothetical protein
MTCFQNEAGRRIKVHRLPFVCIKHQWMKIFATGEQTRLDELRRKIGAATMLSLSKTLMNTLFSGGSLMSFDLIFDLNLDDDPKGCSTINH